MLAANGLADRKRIQEGLHGMTPERQTVIATELVRLEVDGYVGLLGKKYLSPIVTTLDSQGKRVAFININPEDGWAIVAFGPDGGEMKHLFVKDADGTWTYGGVEGMETIH